LYLVDYGTPELKTKGFKLIEKNLHQLNGHQNAEEVRKRIDKIIAGERDLYF
jgi:2-iminoacetate synthase